MAFWQDNAEAGEYDYDFTDYEAATVDPGWYFSAGVIGLCLLINATLPIWLAIGKWWDQSKYQKQLNERRQRQRQKKKDKLNGKGKRRFVDSISHNNNKPTTNISNTKDEEKGDGGLKNTDGHAQAEHRVTEATQMIDLGSISQLDLHDYLADYDVGSTSINRNTNINDDDDDDDDEKRSVVSTASRASRVSKAASDILDSRPRPAKGTARSVNNAYKNRGEKKQKRDIKMAGELIAAQREDSECHPILEGSSSSQSDRKKGDDAEELHGNDGGDVLSPLGNDAVTPLDTVSNYGGKVDDDDRERLAAAGIEVIAVDLDDEKCSVMTGDKGSAVPTMLRYKYRIGRRRKACGTKLLEVADWDADSRRLCSLAFIYAGQGMVSEFFSILKVALMGHYMGIREVNARIITKTLYSFTGILVHGFTDALGLLVPQAHGADNPLMVGRYLQLVIVIYNIMQIPAAIIWGFWTYDAIIWFGYDEETAEIGQMYAYTQIIYMAVEAVEDCLYEWLEVVGHAKYAAIYSISAKFVEKGAFVALLAFGVTDLFTIGLASASVGTVVVLVNLTIIISMGWLDPYWTGLVQTNGFNDRQAVRNVFNIAIPSTIAYFLSYGEWELLTVFVRRMGPAEVTAWSLMGYVWSAFEVLTSGFSSAAEVRVGFRMGANKPEQAKFMAEKGMYVTTVVAIFECGLVFSIAQYIPKWITPDPTLQKMLFQLTPMIGFGSILMVTGFVAWSIVYATGRVRLATFWEAVITWGVTVPGCAIMVFVFNVNLEGMAGAMIIGYAVAANLYMFMLLRTDWAKQAKRINEKHSGSLKYLDTDWDRLPRKIKAAAQTLGYNKKMWESNEEPQSNSKNWAELTPAEQSAASAFGFNRKKWDSNVNGSDTDASSSEEGFGNYDWDELPPDAKKAAKILGYNSSAWDGSKKVASSYKAWKDLTDAERDAAKFLSYDRKKWDKVDDDSVNEMEEGLDDASRSYSKSTLSSLLLSSPTDDQHSYNQSMLSANRLGSDPCYDDMSFDRLPPEAQDAAECLGWTRSSWNANDRIPTEEKKWNELTDNEKSACQSLGWSQKLWDDDNGDGSVSVSTAPSRTYGGVVFDDLPQFVKQAAETLGYTSEKWNNDGSIPAEEKDWDQLSSSEQLAANVLGFSEQSWNGPAGPQKSAAALLEKETNKSIEFKPGYKYYKIPEWSRLPHEVQHAALILGHNAQSWESGDPSPVDAFYWADMSPKLRAAARKLGFHVDSWNRVVRLNLKMFKRRLFSV